MSHVIPSRSKISIKYVTDIIQVTVHKVRNLENTDVIGKSGPFVIKESNVDKNVEVKKIITEFLKDNDNEAFYIFLLFYIAILRINIQSWGILWTWIGTWIWLLLPNPEVAVRTHEIE